MATIILDSDYETVAYNLARIYPDWNGEGGFQVAQVHDGQAWRVMPEGPMGTNARRFTEYLLSFGYNGFCLHIGTHTFSDVYRAELLKPIPPRNEPKTRSDRRKAIR